MSKNLQKSLAIGLPILIVINLLAGLAGAYIGLNVLVEKENGLTATQIVKTEIIQEESAIINVVEKTKNAVVSIIVSKDLPVFEEYMVNPFGDRGFGFFDFGIPYREQVGTEKQQISAGSGFIVSKDGLIITNRHVANDPEAEYTVIMNNGETATAKVIDRDTLYDIAVLQIEKKNGEDFEFLELGDSTNIKVGQHVIAIGNALGQFSNTVSSGIISGLSRSVTATAGFGDYEILENVIQTDASINQGNSGGPLLDYNAKVIGVNVAVAQGAENIGFAIPVGAVQIILESVEKYGEIVRPYLGIRYVLINDALKEKNGLPYDYGALVIQGQTPEELAVIPGGPADKAGIVENDIILEVDGIKIDAGHPLQNEIQKHKIDDEVTLKIYSKGKEKEVEVKLETNPMQ